MYPKNSNRNLNLAQLSSLLQIWRHFEIYGHIWINGQMKTAYDSTTERFVYVCPVILPRYNGKRDYNADYGELECDGLEGLATIKPLQMSGKHTPLVPRPWHVLCERDAVVTKTTTTCLPFHYTCANRVCISPDSVCDGIIDCDDGEDEKDCTCGNEYFQCDNGTCIPTADYCDFIRNCKDGSDEAECVFQSCNQNEFRCENGQCIKKYQRCDFKVDCFDASDESDCGIEYCIKGFLCYSGTCIPKSHDHDLIQDCPGPIAEDEKINLKDIVRGRISYSTRQGVVIIEVTSPYCPYGGTDEVRCEHDHFACFNRRDSCIFDHDEAGDIKGCRNLAHLKNCTDFECPSHFKCPETYCIPYGKVCNGEWDCPDGFDENGCVNYTCPGLYRCKGGRNCIALDQVCDGLVHCKKYRDDERYCEYISNPCPSDCKCTGYSLDCSFQNLSSFPNIPDQSRSLILSGTNLTLTNDSLVNFFYLVYLDLSSNNIKELLPFTFRNQVNILELNLENNRISYIKGHTFNGLSSLKYLLLKHNTIKSIEKNSFFGASRLTVLDLSYQEISHMDTGSFYGLRSLTRMSLKQNNLVSLKYGVFAGLEMIKELDIQHNSLETIESDIFSHLPELSTLRTDAYKFCCLALRVENCSPLPDEYSSCSDLLSAPALQIAVWIIGIISVVGNLFVVIWRSVKDRRTVASTLILNLGLSDCLMGLYLVIVASADTYYRGVYIFYADLWRSSIICNLAGFLSIVSSEVSVFTMVIMTVDRVMMVVFPFKCVTQKFNLKRVTVLCVLGWSICITIGLIPILLTSYFRNFYGQNGVCLPFTLRNVKLPGWEYSFVIFNVINSIAFLIIALGYVLIYCSVQSSRQKTGRHSSEENVRLARKITLIILTDFVCWMPIIILSFMGTFGVFIPGEVSAWLAIVVMPVNSAINPILYTISTIKMAKQVKTPKELSSRNRRERNEM